MKKSREVDYLFSLDDVREKSPIAKKFLDTREFMNQEFLASDNKFTKRFINLDTNAYLPSDGLSKKIKELMGLSVSAALRCESCIFYHLINAYRLGAPRIEVEESLNISLLVGGSITIPSLRSAAQLCNELYSTL